MVEWPNSVYDAGMKTRETVIGILGVGHIASAIVNTLVSGPAGKAAAGKAAATAGADQGEQILLSPRNAAHAAELAARYPGRVRVAASNEEVVAEAQTVFLCVRPQVAAEILGPLNFRADQRIVSLLPMQMEQILPLVDPAHDVVRTLVMPSCVERKQPVLYWPTPAWAPELVGRLGPGQPLTEEAGLAVLWAATAIMASVHGVLGAVTDWAAGHGVPREVAADYTAIMVHSALGPLLSGSADRFAHAAVEVATPGGLNEQVIKALREAGLFSSVDQALEGVLRRIAPGVANR